MNIFVSFHCNLAIEICQNERCVTDLKNETKCLGVLQELFYTKIKVSYSTANYIQ